MTGNLVSAPLDSPAIRVVDLTQHYGVRPILRDIHFSVARGQIAAVMGPNGMGKSTLLAALAGVLWPQYGHVEVFGMRRRENVEVELAIRRQVAYLPAEQWMPNRHTGREYLLAVGALYGIENLRMFDHIEQLGRLFMLENQLDASIISYSTGQKRKLALASTLLTEARLLILDEPFGGGLDPSGLQAIKQVLTRLRTERNVTIVLAVPVAELVDEVADRVLLLKEGRLVADATPSELKAKGNALTLNAAVEQIMNPETDRQIEHYMAFLR